MEYSATRSGSYIEWSSVIAGAVLAIALSSIVLQFGSVIGISDMKFIRAGVDITPQRLLLAGVFAMIIQVLASMIGGYVAGRMRAPMAEATVHEREIRDGIHGVLVWATGTIAVVVTTAIASYLASLSPTAAAHINYAQDVLARQHNIAILLAFTTAAISLVFRRCSLGCGNSRRSPS